MNVFHRFTRQSLRKNRSRTWVTIVGIVLSVAMFTAVTEGAYSGVRYLVRTTEYRGPVPRLLPEPHRVAGNS